MTLPVAMTVVAAPAVNRSNATGLYNDIPASAVAKSRSRALMVNEIAKKGHVDTKVGVAILTSKEITLLKNKNQNNPVRNVKTPVEYLTQLVYDLENQGDPSVKRDVISLLEKIGENEYKKSNGSKFSVRTKDKFSIDQSGGVVKIVCSHCPKQWTLDDCNACPRGG